MKSLRDFFVLFFFFVLLTYFVMFFRRQEMSSVTDSFGTLTEVSHSDRYFVLCGEDEVCLKLPMENYLVGALAASISAEYETEVLKAQAILLRGTLYKEYLESGNTILDRTKKQDFWSDAQMQNAWGDSYNENLQRCVDAVVSTQGVYMAYDGNPINGFFHAMSAGKTRGLSQAEDGEDFGYLRATTCPENLSAPEYEQEIIIRCCEVGELGECEENGYVISVKRNGEKISGQKLQCELGLQSPAFSWKKEGENYIFTVRGKGHGFGMDQYYANILANKGNGYREILDYFFRNVTYQRVE